jgi:hypothetical protein
VKVCAHVLISSYTCAAAYLLASLPQAMAWTSHSEHQENCGLPQPVGHKDNCGLLLVKHCIIHCHSVIVTF